MELDRALARTFLETHPREAARTLEILSSGEAAAALRVAAPPVAGEVLGQMAPAAARGLLRSLDPAFAARCLGALELDASAALLRGMEDDARTSVLEALRPDLRQALERLLRFPPDTAGGVMDPRAMALPSDLTVAEAVRRVRNEPEHAHYNLYLLDPEGRLEGVLNLRELLLARPDQALRDVMQAASFHLLAGTDRRTLIEHPGWREVHSLPVVDAERRYLGAVRYRTRRRLQDELAERPPEPAVPTAEALGDLFWTGVAGLLDAVVAPRR